MLGMTCITCIIISNYITCMTYYFTGDLCLHNVKVKSKMTKYWLHTREYQIDKFLPPKGPIKSSPNSQLLKNPKGDYCNVMVQFKHDLPCKLCY